MTYDDNEMRCYRCLSHSYLGIAIYLLVHHVHQGVTCASVCLSVCIHIQAQNLSLRKGISSLAHFLLWLLRGADLFLSLDFEFAHCYCLVAP